MPLVKDKLRLAVVGVGRMGAFHARTLAQSVHLDVVAVADTFADNATALATELDIDFFASPQALLDYGGVEAWLIATPTLSHPAMVRMALDAGLHVLCEKPLALDPTVSAELETLAVQAERLLQVGFWRRFAPPWARAKELVDAGAIGRPVMMRLSQWDADPPPASFCDPETSGGLAIDCGVHEFDLAEWMTGLRVETVSARNLPLVDPRIGAVGDVDNLVAVLDLTGGAVATVDLSRNCRYGDDVRTEILGDSGAMFIDLLPTSRTRLATAAGIEVVAGSETEDAISAGVLAQADAFARAVRGEMVAVPGARASTRAVAVGRAVQQAANGTPVKLAREPK
jgi:myo-inositol 2-dehydrogenase/D-chiro-inositol 1-dehydrogenase